MKKKPAKSQKPPYQMAVDAINSRRNQEANQEAATALRDKAASSVPGAALKQGIASTNDALFHGAPIHPGGSQVWRDMIPGQHWNPTPGAYPDLRGKRKKAK